MWFLDGKLSYDDVIEKTIFATRQLAKRQLTWLKKFKNATELNDISELPRSFFNKLEKSLQFL